MHDGLSPRTLTLTQFEQAKIAQLSALRTSLCQRLDAIEMNHDAIEIGGGGGTMETLDEALSPPQPLPQPPHSYCTSPLSSAQGAEHHSSHRAAAIIGSRQRLTAMSAAARLI